MYFYQDEFSLLDPDSFSNISLQPGLYNNPS